MRASVLRRPITSLSQPEPILVKAAVASAMPETRPTETAPRPKTETRKTGMSDSIISVETSINRLTSPSTQIDVGKPASVRFVLALSDGFPLGDRLGSFALIGLS